MSNKITYYSYGLNTRKMAMILLIGLSFFGAWARTETNSLRIRNVIIYGESNLMDFWLKYDEDAIVNINQSFNHFDLDTENAEKLFRFQVDAFIAPNKQIRNDFNQMLRSDVNPNIYIQFDERFFNQLASESKPQDFEISLKIGGVERKVLVEFNSENNSEFTQFVKGKAIIHLADFDLEPPKHLFGLIKVKDTIIITFEVQVHSQ